MNIQTAYNNWSQTYDTAVNKTRDLDRMVTQNTLTALSCSSILEIGCGTGKNTTFLAQLAPNIHAIDFSQGMLAKARDKVQANNVTFTTADLTQAWPYANQSFDLITCNLVLEHIEHLTPIFAAAARVLRRQGKFFICELHPFKQYQGSRATFQQAEEKIEIAAFVHHLSDFLDAAAGSGLTLLSLKEWWHEADQNKPPRLVSFLFEKI